jgi:hypothetical protein
VGLLDLKMELREKLGVVVINSGFCFLPKNVALSFEQFKVQKIMTPSQKDKTFCFPLQCPQVSLEQTGQDQALNQTGGNNLINGDLFYTEDHTKLLPDEFNNVLMHFCHVKPYFLQIDSTFDSISD